ncbi:MAG: acetyl-coenzyme A synthetase, partial [Ignavibacteria bacterium]|nr:acetyl-coenzyme A synthetase [Ignavibacteria bacterium]
MSDKKKKELDITSLSRENRIFKPMKSFSKDAYIKSFQQYKKSYEKSIKDPEKFWGKIAEELHWFKKWKTVLKWKAPHSQWFVGGKINLSYNCLDRHLETHRKNKVALFFEGEHGDTQTLTYNQLSVEVNK